MALHDLDLHRRDVMVRSRPPVRLSVIDSGAPGGADAPALLFVHGFGGYALQWKSQMLAFAGSHRVVAPDLRGHGLSGHPRDRYAIEDLVGDLTRVVEALELPPRFVLLGHSFGGAIAASYAVEHPERVERLVLIGTSVDFFSIHAGARLAFRMPSAMLEQVRRFFPKQLAAPAHVLQSMYNNAMSRWDGSAVLTQLLTPTLVVMGERDEVFGKVAYDAVPDRIPNSQLIKVSVSAHLVHLERPDAVNRAISRFIQSPLESRPRAPAASPEMLDRRPWLRHYELAVPHSLHYPSQPMHRLLDAAAQRFPGRIALIYDNRSMRYEALGRATDQFANALIHRGIKPGDRVAVLAGNCPELVIAHYGAMKAGAIVVSLNPTLEGALLAHQLDDSGARVLVLDPASLAGAPWPRPPSTLELVVHAAAGSTMPHPRLVLPRRGDRHQPPMPAWSASVQVVTMRSLLEQAWKAPPQIEVRPDVAALIEYSSGTTGTPKGIVLTHANLMANVVQVRHWLEDLTDGQEVVLCAVSLWHSYGVTSCTNLGLSVAATLVLIPSPQIPLMLRAIARYRPTIFPGVPEMYLGINAYPNVRRFDLKSVRACVSGAAPLPLEVQEVFERLTRGRLVEGYGLTEAGPITHVNPFYGLRKPGSIGVPLPDTDARVVDPRTGETVAIGTAGELVVRGPQVMKGYWNQPELTAERLRDGWLYTGDVARMDSDGYFTIIDRLSDVIAVGSAQIYPREVEEVIYELPSVREVAITPGAEDGHTILVAHVVLNPGEGISADDVIAFCRGRLPEHAVPGRVEFRDALPRTFIGKIMKGKLGGSL